MLFMFNTINLIKDIGILENLVRQSKSRGEGFNSHLTIQRSSQKCTPSIY